MLQLTIPTVELFNEETQEFVSVEGQTLQLEHSLVSLSKWESKWNKAFLSREEKTYEETLDYIQCMTITKNVKPEVYDCLTEDQIKQINSYIEAPMTATVFSQDPHGKAGREIITSELIYYWMISLQIPFECEKWHLNRLLTLIKVCSIKNAPPKKMSKGATMKQYAALNAARRQKYNSKG